VKLSKIAVGNVRKSIKDYAIYFLTIAFGVCIFYIFNSIESQQVMMNPSEDQKLALNLLGRFMDMFSVFISAVLCFLIIYANGFLIKRRKKEFGIYMILGMEKSSISRILVMETVLVGFAGLVAGMLLGVFVSQGMALVTASLMGSEIGEYHFVFSLATVIKTALYFGLTFLFTLAFNVVTVNKQRLIELLNSSRRNERFTPPRIGRSIVIFIGAILCLGEAYYLIGLDSFYSEALVFLAGMSLAVVGTFLFFFSLSGFFLKVIQQCKNVYLRNLNMFVLRQINRKINTTYLSMTFVCVMITLAITALSSGTGIAGAFAAEQRAGTPFDASLTVQRTEIDGNGTQGPVPYQEFDLAAGLGEQGIDLSTLASSYSVVPVFESPTEITLKNPDGELISVKPQLIRLSDYNANLAMQGKEPLFLEEGTFAVHSNEPVDAWRKMLVAYLDNGLTFELPTALAASTPAADGEAEAAVSDAVVADEAAADATDAATGVATGTTTLRTDPSLLQTNMIETSSVRLEAIDLIVPDEYITNEGVNAFPVLRTILNVNYASAASNDLAAFEQNFAELFFDRGIKSPEGTVLGFWMESRTNALQVGSTATTIVAYLALYLGVVFLIASAALLAIAQLSETSDNITRYRMLAKIGTDDKMLRRAVFSQIAIYFGAPFALALVHSVVGIRSVGLIFASLKGTDIFSGTLFAAFIIILIYGGYFLATYIGSKGILIREAIRRPALDSAE
jgi:putative ABC transport system permease protein